jgi:hypothetical protein
VGIRYYMDVHVPAAIAEGLRRRGIDVLTSQEDGTRQADDEVLLARATELGRALVSQDQDLLRIASAWQQRGQPFSGVVFSPQQGSSIGRCVDDLELLSQCCTAEELQDRVIFVPLA